VCAKARGFFHGWMYTFLFTARSVQTLGIGFYGFTGVEREAVKLRPAYSKTAREIYHEMIEVERNRSGLNKDGLKWMRERWENELELDEEDENTVPGRKLLWLYGLYCRPRGKKR
jgi:hypothetical protein